MEKTVLENLASEFGMSEWVQKCNLALQKGHRISGIGKFLQCEVEGNIKSEEQVRLAAVLHASTRGIMNGRVEDLNAQTKFVCKVGKLSVCMEDSLDSLFTRSCPPLVRQLPHNQ
jgi:hypothetical protein